MNTSKAGPNFVMELAKKTAVALACGHFVTAIIIAKDAIGVQETSHKRIR